MDTSWEERLAQRYYFDLKNGRDLIRDDEGVDASGPDEAIEEAQAALDEMRRNDQGPAPIDGWQLIIRDESGMTVGAISLDGGTFHEPTILERAAPLRAH